MQFIKYLCPSHSVPADPLAQAKMPIVSSTMPAVMPAALPTRRLAFIDQLRGVITLLVVFHHTAITYGGAGSWYYKEASDSLGHGPTATFLTLFCAINQTWFMGAFFLFAGYVTPGSYERKGASRYLVDRAIRLGIPLLLFGFFLDALTNSIADLQSDGKFFAIFASRLADFRYAPGPLWFVQVLLLFSMGYAGWRWLRPARRPEDNEPLPSHRALLLAAMGTGTAAFAMRLFVPVGQEYGHMQLGYFPSYIVLFVAGCIAAQHHWLARIDAAYARIWWRVTLIALPILPIVALGYRALTGAGLQVLGGFTGGSLLYAMWEPFVAWGTLLALLWYFRTQVNPERLRHLGRRAYAIYCFHPPIVVGFSLALRTWAAPEALKFLAVGTLSCVTLYLTCGLLLRIPLVARVW